MDRDRFLDLELNAGTQDIYFVRTAIHRALVQALPRFTGTFLDVGCGVQPYRDMILSAPSEVRRYIGMDLAVNEVATYRSIPPDITWDGITIPLTDASVDSAMATEVLEHCPDPDAVLAEIFRVLRPGGTLFFTVPFLWPLHDVPYDEYRYTPFALDRHLAKVGFVDREITPHGGWDASLAQMIGLWVRRRPMSAGKRRVMEKLALPVVKYLIKHDHVPALRSGPMIPGLSGIAVKP